MHFHLHICVCFLSSLWVHGPVALYIQVHKHAIYLIIHEKSMGNALKGSHFLKNPEFNSLSQVFEEQDLSLPSVQGEEQ